MWCNLKGVRERENEAGLKPTSSTHRGQTMRRERMRGRLNKEGMGLANCCCAEIKQRVDGWLLSTCIYTSQNITECMNASLFGHVYIQYVDSISALSSDHVAIWRHPHCLFVKWTRVMLTSWYRHVSGDLGNINSIQSLCSVAPSWEVPKMFCREDTQLQASPTEQNVPVP